MEGGGGGRWQMTVRAVSAECGECEYESKCDGNWDLGSVWVWEIPLCYCYCSPFPDPTKHFRGLRSSPWLKLCMCIVYVCVLCAVEVSVPLLLRTHTCTRSLDVDRDRRRGCNCNFPSAALSLSITAPPLAAIFPPSAVSVSRDCSGAPNLLPRYTSQWIHPHPEPSPGGGFWGRANGRDVHRVHVGASLGRPLRRRPGPRSKVRQPR